MGWAYNTEGMLGGASLKYDTFLCASHAYYSRACSAAAPIVWNGLLLAAPPT